MFKNYVATKRDLRAIEEGLRFVLHPKMNFVFLNPERIIKTLTISYDNRYIYVWTLNPIKLSRKIPHDIIIPDEWQSGWWAGVISKQIEKYLPRDIKRSTRFEIPIISGGLMTPFITLQKAENVQNNPYMTKESYFATMVHEFGHIYWNNFKLWWPSNKKCNTDLLKSVKELYLNNKKGTKIDIKILNHQVQSEVFAFCTEYYASQFFWPLHKKNIDKFAVPEIEKILQEEDLKDLDTQDSVLEPSIYPHNYALVVGKVLLTQYSTNWVTILTQQLTLPQPG